METKGRWRQKKVAKRRERSVVGWLRLEEVVGDKAEVRIVVDVRAVEGVEILVPNLKDKKLARNVLQY